MANERTPLLSDAQSLATQARPDLLHFAKVLGALQAGKLPTQSQINRALDILTSKSSVLSPDRNKGEGKLSDNSRLILKDVKDLLQKVKVWLDSKNKGDVLQELVYQGKRADVDADATGGLDVKAPASTSEVKSDANDLFDTLRTLSKLVLNQAGILSNEAQDASLNLSGELILVLRDLLADAAEEVSTIADKAAEEIRPKEGEEGAVPSKEDVKKKGKEVQAAAKDKAEQSKARLQKEGEPAQEKAQEAKDKAVDRLLQVAKHIQGDPAYNKAFDQLFSLARKYYKRTGEAIEATAASATTDGDVKVNEPAQKAVESFKHLLENLANGKSTDPLVENAQKVFEDIKKDERLSKYLEDIEKFVKEVLENPDYATSKAPKRDAGKLYDRGQDLLKENADWKKDAQALLSEVESFANAIKDDKESKDVAAAFKKLGSDTASTAKVGARMFKGEAGALYRDVANVLVPRALSLLKEIPIPRTEFKSKDVEFVIDDFVITSASFVPDNLTINTASEFSASRVGKANATADISSTTRVRFDGLRFEAKDVSFWVRRPGAIVLSEERGLLDLSLLGRGLAGDIKLALADDEDHATYFKVTDSKVKLHDLSLKIHDNYHYLLSFIFGPLINSALKLSLQNVLGGQIADAVEQLDWTAKDVHRRAVRYENAGYNSAQAYGKALYEPPPNSPSGPPFLAGVHSTSKGFIRDDRGPRDFQLAIGGEQLLPGKKGPKSSLDRAANRAKGAADGAARDLGVDPKKAQSQIKKNAPSQADADAAKRQGEQFRGIVEDEFSNAEDEAEAQRKKESGDEGWKSDVFDL